MRWSSLIPLFVVCTAGLFGAELEDLNLSCRDANCQLDFRFKSAKGMPSFYQQDDASRSVLTLGFSEMKLPVPVGSYSGVGKSSLFDSLRLESKKGGGAALLFHFQTNKNVRGDRHPASLKGKRTLRLSFANPGRKGIKWSLLQSYKNQQKAAAIAEKKKADKLQKSAAIAEKKKAVELQKSAAIAEKKKAVELQKSAAIAEKKKAVELQKSAAIAEKKKADKLQKSAAIAEKKKADKLQKAPASVEPALVLKKLSCFRNRQRERFVLEFNSVLSQNLEVKRKGNQILVFSPGLRASATLGAVEKSGSGLVLAVQISGKKGQEVLKISLQKKVAPLLFITDNTILLQGANRDPRIVLSSWNDRESLMIFKAPPVPGDEILSLDEFISRTAQGGAQVDPRKVFHPAAAPRGLWITRPNTPLYEKADGKSKVLLTLKKGQQVMRVRVKQNWFEVQSGKMLGFVSKKNARYREELTKAEVESLQKTLVAKPKKNQKSSPEKVKNLPKQTQKPVEKVVPLDTMMSALERVKTSKKVTYSSYARRDPFIGIELEEDEGINIDGVRLRAIFWEETEPMALLEDVRFNGVSYTLKEGDKILNGKVLKITRDEVLFILYEFGISRRFTMTLLDN